MAARASALSRPRRYAAWRHCAVPVSRWKGAARSSTPSAATTSRTTLAKGVGAGSGAATGAALVRWWTFGHGRRGGRGGVAGGPRARALESGHPQRTMPGDHHLARVWAQAVDATGPRRRGRRPPIGSCWAAAAQLPLVGVMRCRGSNPKRTDDLGDHHLATGVGAGAAPQRVPPWSPWRTGGNGAGAAVGAVAGGLAGKGAGEVVNPKRSDDLADHHLATGVGASSGAVAGAALGAVGGPVGMAAGAAIGAAAGGAAGKGTGEVVNPKPGDKPRV